MPVYLVYVKIIKINTPVRYVTETTKYVESFCIYELYEHKK